MDPKKVRNSHRRLFTNAVERVNRILNEKPTDRDLLETSVAYMCERYEKITKLDDDVFSQISEDEAIEDADAAEGYALAFFEIQRKIKLHRASSQSDVGSSGSDASVRASATTSTNVRLPKLSLPFFDGNILEWLPFWETFSSAVHTRADLTGANKFDYLMAQLKGEASSLVGGFQHTTECYSEAVILLHKTYGDTRRIIRSHIYALFDLPIPECSAKGLFNFRNDYEKHLRSLQVLKVDVLTASDVYTAVITRKLPVKIRDNINRATGDNYLSLDNLRKAIDEEIARLKVSEPEVRSGVTGGQPSVRDLPDASRPNERDSNQHDDNFGQISTFQITSIDGTNSKCEFCNGLHNAINCTVYDTPRKRECMVKSLRLCYKCLSYGHRVDSCKSNQNCPHCHGRHHASICFSLGNGAHKVDIVNIAQSDMNVHDTSSWPLHEHESTSSQSLTNTNAHIANFPRSGITGSNTMSTSPNVLHSRTSTILPTAVVGIGSPAGVVYTRTLFDQGAQRSFLLAKTATELQLTSCGKTPMTINGFNSRGVSNYYDVVRINIVTEREYVPINAIVVDKLPGGVVMNGRGAIVRGLLAQGLPLADPYPDDEISNIQMIIGSDYYFDFVFSEKVNDIACIPSKLGYLLSGPTPINDMDNSANNTGSSFITALHVSGDEIYPADEPIINSNDALLCCTSSPMNADIMHTPGSRKRRKHKRRVDINKCMDIAEEIKVTPILRKLYTPVHVQRALPISAWTFMWLLFVTLICVFTCASGIQLYTDNVTGTHLLTLSGGEGMCANAKDIRSYNSELRCICCTLTFTRGNCEGMQSIIDFDSQTRINRQHNQRMLNNHDENDYSLDQRVPLIRKYPEPLHSDECCIEYL